LNQKLAKISEHPIFSGFDWTFFFQAALPCLSHFEFLPIKRKEKKANKKF